MQGKKPEPLHACTVIVMENSSYSKFCIRNFIGCITWQAALHKFWLCSRDGHGLLWSAHIVCNGATKCPGAHADQR